MHGMDFPLGRLYLSGGRDVNKGAIPQALRGLRTEIAREESVPPYIVFSDKTLVLMCRLRPENKAEMLEVSGVGEHKFEKYGARFLQRIAEHV